MIKIDASLYNIYIKIFPTIEYIVFKIFFQITNLNNLLL